MHLSIGALSRATGLPAATLRTWELRYGRPRPERAPSGHRRYNVREVEYLRLAKNALSAGHRAAEILALDEGELRALLAKTDAGLRGGGAAHRRPQHSSPGGPRSALRALVAPLQRLDERAFDAAVRQEWARVGALRFVTEGVVDLMRAVGEQWAEGTLSVAHEHLATAALQQFLAQQWTTLSRRDGRRVVLATLPGELHSLALHCAAVVLAMAGARVVYVGADTPVDDVVRATVDVAADGVVLAFSPTGPSQSPRRLAKLLDALPRHVAVAAGGACSGNVPPRVVWLDSFDGLGPWFHRLSSESRSYATAANRSAGEATGAREGAAPRGRRTASRPKK